MTTPAPRTPIRLGRGLKANLDAGLAAGDIKEGELVYAKDEDILYMVENGIFVAAGGGGGGGGSSAYWGGGDFNTGASDLDAIDGGLFT